MDLRKIKKLIELLEDSELSEMEIKEGEESIRLTRGGAHSTAYDPRLLVPAIAPGAAPSVEFAPAAGAETVSERSDLPEGHIVKSPMVGTFYASSSPEVDAFVVEGSQVNVGDTLCIIEAMKIFNAIESDCAGIIRKIIKSNGDPVEYGEALFVIDQRG
jgi:acetyl-CoA carboxylase biotin carboxyl carrier protein